MGNERQILVNGFANGWYIDPIDFNNKKDFELVLELSDQRLLYYGLLITSLTLIVSITLIFLFRKKGF